MAAVDSKHQIVVHGEAFGEAQEHGLLEPMVQAVRENFRAIGKDENIFENTKLTADSGFHTEKNVQKLIEEHIDGYVADILFRKRDPRFNTAARHKPKKENKSERFTPTDFIYDKANQTCICPAGKRLYLKNATAVIGNYRAVCFQGAKRDCGPCTLRSRCLKDPNQRTTRQVCFFEGRAEQAPETKGLLQDRG